MQLGETDVLQLVKDTDFGGRSTAGFAGKVMLVVGLVWVAFQMWYASPIPFSLPSGFRFGLFNDTEARSIHLALGLFLAFLAFPAFKRSPRDYVPWQDWLFAIAGAATALYLIVFYKELSLRPGNPTGLDVVVGTVGVLLLLEATRRAVGLPMAILAVLFLGYVMAGSDAAGRDRAQGRFGAARDLAHVDGDRGRVRHRARCVGELHLRLRAVRHAARSRGRWQLHDAGELRAAGASARRAGQGCCRFVGAQRPDLRLVRQQRGVRRHLHDPADEARRLRRREGSGDRDRVVGQRPDHAAGDGRGGLPDGRICRHPVLGHRQARVHPGGHQLHRALLHRAPRGAEARPGGDRA